MLHCSSICRQLMTDWCSFAFRCFVCILSAQGSDEDLPEDYGRQRRLPIALQQGVRVADQEIVATQVEQALRNIEGRCVGHQAASLVREIRLECAAQQEDQAAHSAQAQVECRHVELLRIAEREARGRAIQ